MQYGQTPEVACGKFNVPVKGSASAWSILGLFHVCFRSVLGLTFERVVPNASSAVRFESHDGIKKD